MARRGFTLVEVLVALLIMAVIAAMGWQGVSGMVKARDIGAQASDRTLRLSTVIGQWEQDLAAIYDSGTVPAIQFDGASLRLVRRSDSGVQLVVWALREGRWQRWPGQVVRRSADLREGWLASQQLQGQEPGQLTVLDGVTGWQLYFWRGQGWSNAQSSGDQVTETVVNPNANANTNAGTGTTAGATPGTTTDTPATGSAAGTNTSAATGTANGAATGEATGTATGNGTSAAAGNTTGTATGAAAGTPAVTTRSRTLLPAGVRLQLDLPEGRIQRDVLLPPAP